jgi:hypothetical protein
MSRSPARIKRDPILREGICMMHIPFAQGGLQDALCLRLDLLNGWLFKIDSTRVKSELREKVQTFQRECYRALHDHFLGIAEPEREKIIRESNETTSLNLRLVTESRHTHGTRAAAQLWDALGLPHVPAMVNALQQYELFEPHDDRQVA